MKKRYKNQILTWGPIPTSGSAANCRWRAPTSRAPGAVSYFSFLRRETIWAVPVCFYSFWIWRRCKLALWKEKALWALYSNDTSVSEERSLYLLICGEEIFNWCSCSPTSGVWSFFAWDGVIGLVFMGSTGDAGFVSCCWLWTGTGVCCCCLLLF